jgi:exosome complex RNA-binding protein Csl4
MPYVLPQTQVFQDFTLLATANANPLRAFVAGPHAYLLRYSDDDERAKGLLGYYDHLIENNYEWPDRPAGGVVDDTYVKVWIKDALLKYFEDSIGSGVAITKVSGYNNRVRSATIGFQTNGAYLRGSQLFDRDVAVGDVAKVRGLDDEGDPVTLWTYVRDVVGDVVDSEVGDATYDSANPVNPPSSQSASSSVSKVAGPDNCVDVTADHSAYEGLTSGKITETYDILITEGSVNGDYTVARARVISGSGTDDVLSITPSAMGVPTAIGTRGLTVTFDELDTSGCSEDAEDAGVAADELIPGQRWRVTVNDAFTPATAASGGTYDSENNTTYIVEVTKGGLFAAEPQISVSTTNGIDISGPTDVTASAAAVDVGTLGVTIAFTGTGLRKGDRYYVECVGRQEGPMRTIVLGHNLSTEIDAGAEVDLTLFIRKPLLQVPKNRTGAAPLTNWDTSETEITIADGITAYDDTWTDDGVPMALDVLSESSKGYGKLYVEYRAWLSDLCNEVNGVSDVSGLDDAISGPLSPDNPLKWGVYRALTNSNGTEVKFASVCDPTELESWANVLELIVGRDDVYGLVPLTRWDQALDLFVAHANAMSAPEQGLWRVVWLNLAGVPEIPVVHAGSTVPNHVEATTTDGEVALAVVEDDSETSGSQYTIVRCTTANADFITNGVRPGDILRNQYVGDGFGNYSYSEYVIDEVQAEDQLRLLTGPAGPITVAAKFEIWRNLSATEESAEIALQAGARGNRRVRAVWPDRVEDGGDVFEGYHLCATLAGLASGIVPHQGMTNLEITGYTNMNRTLQKFNRTQLDAMAHAGVWIVTQDPVAGDIYTRHAVTTADYDDLNKREEMITRNVDSISFRFKDHFKPYIGVTNVTPQTIQVLTLEAKSLIQVLSATALPNLGAQLITGEVLSVQQSVSLKDNVTMTVSLSVPYALNVLAIRLVI